MCLHFSDQWKQYSRIIKKRGQLQPLHQRMKSRSLRIVQIEVTVIATMTTGIKVRHECGNKGYIIPKSKYINIEKGEDDDSNHKENNKVQKKIRLSELKE